MVATVNIAGVLTLPGDVALESAAKMSAADRASLGATEKDFLLYRPGMRLTTRVVSADLAAILEKLRGGLGLAEAVASFSTERKLPPQDVLFKVYPAVRRLLKERIVAEVGSASEAPVSAVLSLGGHVEGWVVERIVQSLFDTDVYRVVRENVPGCLKLARTSQASRLVAHEWGVLKRLEGHRVAVPAPLATGQRGGHRWMVSTWDGGLPLTIAFMQAVPVTTRIEAACAMVRSYADLHEAGVVHGDVAARNILLDMVCKRATLVDFGYAIVNGDVEGRLARLDRYGAPERVLLGHGEPISAREEQYSVAALIFHLLTGARHIDLPDDRNAMRVALGTTLRAKTLSSFLPRCGLLDEVMSRALEPEPGSRFGTTREFSDALETAAQRLSKQLQVVQQRPQLDAVGWLKERFGVHSSHYKYRLARPSPTSSLMYGAAGVAWGLLQAAKAAEDSELLTAASGWSQQALSSAQQQPDRAFFPEDGHFTAAQAGKKSLFHSMAGCHYVEALVCDALGDVTGTRMAVSAFLDVVPSSHEVSCVDFMAGIPGYLGAVSVLTRLMNSLGEKQADALRTTGMALEAAVLKDMETWKPVEEDGWLLGAAHGRAGALTAVVAWHRRRRTAVPERVVGLMDELGKLGKRGRLGGRTWPRRAGTTSEEPWGGWCNGGAGFLQLWCAAAEATTESRYMDLAEQAAWGVWRLAVGDGSLCCGAAGMAVALARFARLAESTTWLLRAEALSSRALEFNSGAEGIFKGEIGAAAINVGVFLRPGEVRMPLVDAGGP